MSEVQNIEISIDRINLNPDSRYIYHPRYINTEKTILKAIVRFPDGSLNEIEAKKDDRNSALIRDIYLQYSEAEIEMYTHRELCMQSKMKVLFERHQEDQKRQEHLAKLFQAKTEALQIDCIQKSTDKTISRKIRSAKTATEVYGLVAMALYKESIC